MTGTRMTHRNAAVHPPFRSAAPAARFRAVAFSGLVGAAAGLLISYLLPRTYAAAFLVLLSGHQALHTITPSPPSSATPPVVAETVARWRSPAFSQQVSRAAPGKQPPVSLSYSVTSGDAIMVRAESGNPESAAAWAETAARAGVADVEARRRAERDAERTTLRSAAAAAWADVRGAAASLEKLRRQARANGADGDLSARLREQVRLAEKERAARGTLASLGAKLQLVREKLARTPRTAILTAQTPNPEWRSLSEQLATLRGDRERLAASTPDNGAELQRLDTRIQDTQARLAAKKATVPERREGPNPAWESLSARVKELEAHQAAADRLARELGQASTHLAAMVDGMAPWQVEAQRQARKVEELRTEHAGRAARLRDFQRWEKSLSPAAVATPAGPTAPLPRHPLPPVLLGLLAGLFSGAALAFRPGSRRPVRHAGAVAQATGWPLLAEWPADAGDASHDALAANLRFVGAAQPVRVLLVAVLDGRGDVGAAVARAQARRGLRVALVETNPARPDAHWRLGATPRPGLADVLAGQLSLEAALEPGPAPGLRVLSAGALPLPPASLPTETLRQVVDALHGQFDYVILQASPGGHPALFAALAREAGGVAVALDPAYARWDELLRLRNTVNELGIPVVGMITRADATPSAAPEPDRLADLRVPAHLRQPLAPSNGAEAGGESHAPALFSARPGKKT